MDEIQRVGKRNYCLNCDADIKPFDAYCSACGQKVDDNKLGMNKVLSEFFENYISLDSRFGRTFVPFLFKPGFLSQQFIHGKRRNFANPFRLYILSSILFFFCFSSYFERDTTAGKPIINVELTELKNFDNLPEESRKALEMSLDSKTKEALNLNSDSSFKSAYGILTESQRASIVRQLDRDKLTALNLLSDTTLLEKKAGLQVNIGDIDKEVSFENILQYRDSSHLSDEEVFKVLFQEETLPYYREVLYQRLIRLSRANDNEVRGFILGNLSLAMFVLIPLFAIFMKLFYFRRNKYYVAHLIHTIYLQAFAFMLFGLILSLVLSIKSIEAHSSTLFTISSLVFFVYFYLSLKRLYGQSFFSTFVKSISLVFFYFLLGAVVFAGEVLTSVLLF